MAKRSQWFCRRAPAQPSFLQFGSFLSLTNGLGLELSLK